VRIEFEYLSRNFLKHRHRVDKCDIIVCWIHNWPECPLEVLELRKVVSSQRPAFSQNLKPLTTEDTKEHRGKQNVTTDKHR
jgi:hypothetical protein